MLKRKIKIILIGLFSILFMGLVYSLFNAKPEIISDESLRIEEPAIPGIESQIERAVNASMRSDPIANIEIESSAESAMDEKIAADLPENSAQESSGMESIVELDDGSQSVSPFGDDVNSPVSESIAELDDSSQSVSPFGDDVNPPAVSSSEVLATNQDGFVTFDNTADDKEDIAVSKSSNGAVETQKDDIDIVTDTSKFLDLNSAEVESVKPEMVLTEGDQLIVDDINQSLSKYKSVISENTKKKMVKQNKVKTVALNPKVKAKNQESSKDGNETVSVTMSKKPSVFTMPEVDESLMAGDSEISKEYRQTMSKLISINAKLHDADEENAQLKTRFEIVVSQNRQLARIIRDINSKIDSYTSTN